MGNNLAIELLIKEREKLVIEKQKMLEKFDGQINEIEKSIETLSGKKVWDYGLVATYDDEHPDYIKGSVEEI